MKDTNLIIGKKNTGKTKNVLFNEVRKAIANDENLFIYNDRDEYYKEFYKELVEKNYNILLLNLQDTTKSNGYNPLLVPYLLYKENKLDDSLSMINTLALEIFKDDSGADPFWENMASNYFTGLVLLLFKEAKFEEINIGSIQVMISQGEFKYGETTYLKKYLENVDVTNPIYLSLSPIVFAPPETKGSILSVVKQKLNLYLLKPQLLNLLNTNEINLKEINNKTAIFVIGKERVNDIANIFLDQFINIISTSFTFVLDNFDSLRSNLSLNTLLNDASYKGNKVYISVHSGDILKDIYGKYILDKFENIMNVESLNTCDNVSIENNLSDSDYPLLSMNIHSYFNFKEFIDSIN